MKKNVLILGGTSDVGKALAHQYANQGYHIQLAGRKKEQLETISKDLSIRYGTETTWFKFDAQDFASHQKEYQQLKEKPTIVICVFGYLGEQKNAESNFDEAKKIIDINYTGAVSILEIIANDFEKKKTGTIIGISSVAGDRGRQSNYIYGSAKAAFSTYLSGLRNRLYAKNVHVMTVKPGFMDTKMTQHLTLPKKLTASPNSVAKTIVKAQLKQKNILYVKSIWKWIMLIIKHIPEFIFKRLKM